jgi:hypothetical protein
LDRVEPVAYPLAGRSPIGLGIDLLEDLQVLALGFEDSKPIRHEIRARCSVPVLRTPSSVDFFRFRWLE